MPGPLTTPKRSAHRSARPIQPQERSPHRSERPIQLRTLILAAVLLLSCLGLAARPAADAAAQTPASAGHPNQPATAQPVTPYTPSPPSRTTPATVTATTVRNIPRSFMGLSLGNSGVENFTTAAAFPNYMRLLTAPGDGPLILRVGGTTADESYWENDEAGVIPKYRVPASFAYDIQPPFLDALASAVKQSGARVILTVNAAAHDPQMAANYLRAAEATLPARSLEAAAIGNEPDIYMDPTSPVSHHQPWARHFGPGQYAVLYGQYARTLSAYLPGLALAGPELASPSIPWQETLLNQDQRHVALTTAHLYPWNACCSPQSACYPQLAYYLLAGDAAAAADTLTATVSAARSDGLPFRLTELGSATCGGVEGVNNTFVTALWAINELFDLIDVGVSGVNVHLRPDTPNTAIQAVAGTLTARPLLYGLATVAQALGKDGRLMQVTGRLPANVKLWAVYTPTAWHLLFVNGNATAQSVNALVAAGPEPMTASLLTAPSPMSTSATLAGQTISSDGTWQGALEQTTIPRVNNRYDVTIPPSSAVLGTVPIPAT